mmetsp:Transcript_81126/g.173545  ORF Transcript_81126/g.173545 Transcript_81126/m.173545 type:complete len:243 (-) Transcript_81126:271-999(-)
MSSRMCPRHGSPSEHALGTSPWRSAVWLMSTSRWATTGAGAPAPTSVSLSRIVSRAAWPSSSRTQSSRQCRSVGSPACESGPLATGCRRTSRQEVVRRATTPTWPRCSQPLFSRPSFISTMASSNASRRLGSPSASAIGTPRFPSWLLAMSSWLTSSALATIAAASRRTGASYSPCFRRARSRSCSRTKSHRSSPKDGSKPWPPVGRGSVRSWRRMRQTGSGTPPNLERASLQLHLRASRSA